ncbi:competence/damage-inducible protein cinA [Arthrobacter crystallopoietes BAB-32]|uniref:Competence/damage-inducible protein cinA n=1 Tax=Arthrobacter crystallopoietes BAB-32 TaxID=1246476 RepID=N1VA33_9MICC|nr:CinA family protein [Arthrobacter crystallopoietes]EMY35153.1 competence/damage-inducible protein cinA [Arthrobacter crystallopoietes BAB-32]
MEQQNLPQQVILAAVAKGLTVATAESLTAGMVSAALATVPGASGALQGGVVSYQNKVKSSLLGVDEALMDRNGSVDADVARQMAEGARRALAADIAVATTGAAGPEPHGGKAVGTVYVGVATAAGSKAAEFSFSGDRAEIRQQACQAALAELLHAVDDASAGAP